MNALKSGVDLIYEKVATYTIPHILSEIAYSISRNRETAKLVKLVVTTAVEWVVFMDQYQETGLEEYDAVAKAKRAEIDVFLNAEQKNHFSKLEADIVSPFWIYEKELKVKIYEGVTFTKEEVINSILRRSSDAVLYGNLVSYFCDLPPHTIEALHATQALDDIEDCIEDYEEDLANKEPNILFLCLLNHNLPVDEWPTNLPQAILRLKELGISIDLMNLATKLRKDVSLVCRSDSSFSPLDNEAEEIYVLIKNNLS